MLSPGAHTTRLTDVPFPQSGKKFSAVLNHCHNWHTDDGMARLRSPYSLEMLSLPNPVVFLLLLLLDFFLFLNVSPSVFFMLLFILFSGLLPSCRDKL